MTIPPLRTGILIMGPYKPLLGWWVYPLLYGNVMGVDRPWHIWSKNFFLTYPHLGTYPRLQKPTVYDSEFFSSAGERGCLGYAPGVCWGSLRYGKWLGNPIILSMCSKVGQFLVWFFGAFRPLTLKSPYKKQPAPPKKKLCLKSFQPKTTQLYNSRIPFFFALKQQYRSKKKNPEFIFKHHQEVKLWGETKKQRSMESEGLFFSLWLREVSENWFWASEGKWCPDTLPEI